MIIMAKNGWYRKPMKDRKGALREYNILYKNGRIIKKQLIEKKSIPICRHCHIPMEREYLKKRKKRRLGSYACPNCHQRIYVIPRLSTKYEDGSYKTTEKYGPIHIYSKRKEKENTVYTDHQVYQKRKLEHNALKRTPAYDFEEHEEELDVVDPLYPQIIVKNDDSFEPTRKKKKN